jgi:transcriptional regulator with XRE-family HTH domain
MSEFSQRLRNEIEYLGLSQGELAERAGIKKRALDMYLGVRQCMPPADTAVKIASALGVSVEYLVSGKIPPENENMYKYIKYRDIVDELPYLSESSLDSVRNIIKTVAGKERRG